MASYWEIAERSLPDAKAAFACSKDEAAFAARAVNESATDAKNATVNTNAVRRRNSDRQVGCCSRLRRRLSEARNFRTSFLTFSSSETRGLPVVGLQVSCLLYTSTGTPVFFLIKLTVPFCQSTSSPFKFAMSPWLPPKCQHNW